MKDFFIFGLNIVARKFTLLDQILYDENKIALRKKVSVYSHTRINKLNHTCSLLQDELIQDYLLTSSCYCVSITTLTYKNKKEFNKK